MFFQSSTPKGEIELVPQPELTLSGSVHCLEAPLLPFSQLDTRVKSSEPREGGREGPLSLLSHRSPKVRFRTVFAPVGAPGVAGANLTRARDGPPSLGWPRRCEGMELSNHQHFMDFVIFDALASEPSPESCSPPALSFICARERRTLPGMPF